MRVSTPVEAELDALFRLSPGEMVAARDALAARLRKAGDKSGAAAVKALKRPTPAAWALNQLHFMEPALIQQALEEGTRLRSLHAQAGVTSKTLSGALEAQRALAQRVVDVALALCREQRLPDGPEQRKKLLTLVLALMSGSMEGQLGRLTQDAAAAGFDALGEVAAVAPVRPATPLARAPTLPKPDKEAEQRARAIAQLEAELTAIEGQIASRSAQLAERRNARSERAAQLTSLRGELAELEQRLRTQRDRVAKAERELVSAEAELADAEQAQKAAEQTRREVRARLLAIGKQEAKRRG